MSARRAALGAVLVLALAPTAGCSGEDNSLSGSLGDVYRLDYSSVRARLYTSELSVEYVDQEGAVPVRVTLRVDEVTLGERSYDLVTYGDVSGRGRDGSDIPRFTGGTFELDRFAPNQGATVAGTFDAKFDTGRDTLSLTGSFDTTLELIQWPPRPDVVARPDGGSGDAATTDAAN